MRAQISAVGAYLPEKRMANEEFTKFLDTSDEWIVANTGIRYRHVARDNQAASDLGYEAAIDTLKKASLSPEDIDLILVATATPDYRGFPSTACIIQDKLGAKNAGAFDIVAACTGFVYGLETARNFVIGGSARNVLLVATEVYSRVLDYTDRKTCVLFGDGAGAVLINNGQAGAQDRGILDSILGSDGSKAHTLTIPGGSRPCPHKKDENHSHFLTMDGRPVYNFAVRVINEVIETLLKRNNLKISDLAHIVPHQANIRIIQSAAKRLKIPVGMFYTNIHDVANTSAASIPLALAAMIENGKLKPGDLIITVGFGGGLTYGGNLIRW
ncbi:MAG TPA: beta-ketoacyl-ACP synthase III [Spirochaetia bacterium]|nr:beta-ketoacyl-ACP synthase III [Spirochaetia bacterium]